MRAPVSTSSPAANSFVRSQPGRAIRGKCTFAGVGKSREEIEYALEQRVYSFNVESEAELELHRSRSPAQKRLRAPIALRVNPDVDPHTHEYISTGSHENKFGIAARSTSPRFTNAPPKCATSTSSACRCTSVRRSPRPNRSRRDQQSAPLVRDLKSKYGIKFFSIGGGMGIIYRRALESGSGKWWHDHGGESSAFSVRDYADAIVPPLRDLGLRILLEPGRFLVGNAGVLLTRVRYIKKSGAEEVRDRRCRHERPDSAGAVSELSRNRAGRRTTICRGSCSFPSSKGRTKITIKNTNKTDREDRYCRAGLRIRRFLCARSRNAGTARRRSARDHERRRLRICDGFELQFAAACRPKCWFAATRSR